MKIWDDTIMRRYKIRSWINRKLNKVRRFIGLMSVPTPWLRAPKKEADRLKKKVVQEAVDERSFNKQVTTNKIRDYNRTAILKFLGAAFLILQIIHTVQQIIE